jgi:hypothetical protein
LVFQKIAEDHFVKNKTRISRLAALLAACATIVLPQTSSACAVCMGGANSPINPAINAAIFLMIGCIGAMLAGICGFALYLFKRSKKPLPPHEELAGMI